MGNPVRGRAMVPRGSWLLPDRDQPQASRQRTSIAKMAIAFIGPSFCWQQGNGGAAGLDKEFVGSCFHVFSGNRFERP